jgi:lipoprotein NlpI
MSATLISDFAVLPATLLSGLLLALMIVRLSRGDLPPALFGAAASLGVVMGTLIIVAEAPFNLAVNARLYSPVTMALGFAGFPEETVKFVAIFFFLRPHYLARTPRALVLAAAAMALGFALTEDVLYIARAGPQWGAVAGVRALTAVPVHVFFGAIDGFAIAASAYSATRSRALARIVATWLAASLLHGLYDLPQLILNTRSPYPQYVADLAGRVDLSLLTLLHGVVLCAALCIAWAGFACLRAIDRAPFPPPPLPSAPRQGWARRFVFARATGWIVGGLVLLASLAMVATTAVTSFVLAQADPVIRGAVYVVLPMAIALTLLRQPPRPAGVAAVARAGPVWRRPGFVVAALIGAGVLVAAYHWGDRPARDILAARIELGGMKAAVAGDHEGAIREYDRALALDPDFVDVLAKRAQSNLILQRYNLALADLDRALRLEPRNVALLLQRAGLHREIHASAEVLADLDRALAVTPNDPEIWATRAQTDSESGNDAAAASDIARAAALNPRQPDTLKTQAVLFLKAGDYYDARRILDAELALNPGDADALFMRGRLRFYRQDLRDAAVDFAHASAFFGVPYPAIWLFLARARMGSDGRAELAARTQRWPNGNWPAPVIQLLLGNLSAEGARAAAANGDQRCEADFYNGELLLSGGARAPAIAALQLALKECPLGFIEREGAVAELQWLDRPAASAQTPPTSPAAPAPPDDTPAATSQSPPAFTLSPPGGGSD